VTEGGQIGYKKQTLGNMKARNITLLVTIAAFICSGIAEAADTNSPVREGPRVVPPAEVNVGRLIADLEFAPIAGKKFRLSSLKPASAVVIAFTSTSCPVTKRYAPTLAALEKEYGARGVKFIFVNPRDTDGDVTEAIRTHQFASPYVRDGRNSISGSLRAQSTAEVFVLDAARTLVYRGAVDDQYGLAYSRSEPRQKYLADALDAVLAGNTPPMQATTAPGCVLETAKDRPTVPLTYHARISRILQQNCVECHRAGGVAPFSLESYQEVTSHAGMIRKQVEKGVMPPWFAVPTHPGPSPWANDRTLAAQDKADLLAWLAGGRKEGEPSDAPLPRVFPKEWAIGTPDAIVRIPDPIEVKATGTMPYQNILVETKFGEDRWVQTMEVRPTAREVVHHALVYVIPADKMRTRGRRGGDREAGNFFAAYVPGNNVLKFPEGFAKVIPAGATLHFQIHYTPAGTATRDQTALGLVFAKTAPRHEVRVAAVAAKLDIPPGEANYEARGRIPVPYDAKLMSFMPHMHLRGKAYRYELQLPGGQKNLLLEVPRYDFNWQLQYRLAEYIDAPAGSMLLGAAWYDNSANNPANPDPNQRVKWGEQTDDEMMLGYFEYYVPGVEPGTKKPSLIEMALRDGGLVFNGLDQNGDGKITIDESPSARQFREADADSDGSVTREEFRVFWQQQQAKRTRPEPGQ
jgi:thiol-disulfide isomerase/thioredoxin/mono/diheme cytochrome c family protein